MVQIPAGRGHYQRRRFADLAAAPWQASGLGGDAGIDFDQHRAGRRQRIKGPDRDLTAQVVEHPHPGQARFTDLSRADKIEAASAIAMLGGSLDPFNPPQPADAAAEQIADDALAMAEMAACLRMGKETGDGEKRIIGAKLIDKLPEPPRVLRALRPLREIGGAIKIGQGHRQVDADQYILLGRR